MKELICIVCPKGCRLKVDEGNDYAVTGNACDRGEEYGRVELTNPTRVITSTVRTVNGIYSRCPVKTEKPVPKDKIFDIMGEIKSAVLYAPVEMGKVVISDVCGTGVDVVTTRKSC